MSSLDASGLSRSLFSSPQRGSCLQTGVARGQGLSQTCTALPAAPQKGTHPDHPNPKILPRTDISKPGAHPPQVCGVCSLLPAPIPPQKSGTGKCYQLPNPPNISIQAYEPLPSVDSSLETQLDLNSNRRGYLQLDLFLVLFFLTVISDHLTSLSFILFVCKSGHKKYLYLLSPW